MMQDSYMMIPDTSETQMLLEIEESKKEEQFIDFWGKIRDRSPWSSMTISTFMDLTSAKCNQPSSDFFDVDCGEDWLQDFFQEVVDVWEELQKYYNSELDFHQFCKDVEKHYESRPFFSSSY